MENYSDTVSEENYDRTQNSGTLFGVLVVLASALSFEIFSKIVENCFTPKAAQHSPWRWKNILVSFVHSILSGTWAVTW